MNRICHTSITIFIIFVTITSVAQESGPSKPYFSPNIQIVAFDRDLIQRVRMSPNGRYLFTYFEDIHFDEKDSYNISIPVVIDRYWQALWDTEQSLDTPSHTLELGDWAQSDAIFSLDSDMLAIKTPDSLIIYSLPEFEEIKVIPTPNSSWISADQNLAWTNDKRYLATQVDKGIFVYDFWEDTTFQTAFEDSRFQISLGNGFWIIEPQLVPQSDGRNVLPTYDLIICSYSLDQCHSKLYEDNKTIRWIDSEYSRFTVSIRAEYENLKARTGGSRWLQVWNLDVNEGIKLVDEYRVPLHQDTTICPIHISPIGNYILSNCNSPSDKAGSIWSINPFQELTRFGTGATSHWFNQSDYFAMFYIEGVIKIYNVIDEMPVDVFSFENVYSRDVLRMMEYAETLSKPASIQITENDDLLMFNYGFAVWLIPIEHKEK